MAAGGEADFDGADELGRVVGVDACGGCGVEPVEDAVQPALGRAALRCGETVAQFLLAGGPAKRPSSERAQVEAGAAGDDGQMIAGGDLARAARAWRE